METKTATMSLGQRGPLLLRDNNFIEEMSHFDRERIPERVVHAKGAGAFGYFETTHDVTQYTKLSPFSKIGKRTPLAIRFSTVGKNIKKQEGCLVVCVHFSHDCGYLRKFLCLIYYTWIPSSLLLLLLLLLFNHCADCFVYFSWNSVSIVLVLLYLRLGLLLDCNDYEQFAQHNHKHVMS